MGIYILYYTITFIAIAIPVIYVAQKIRRKISLSSEQYLKIGILLILSFMIIGFNERYLEFLMFILDRNPFFDNISELNLIFGSVWLNILKAIIIIYSIYEIGSIIIKKTKSNQINLETKVDDFIEKLFSNKRFFTAFSSSLPVGEKDADTGLDYIPFILANTEAKRLRFKRNSQLFLISTLSLGLFSIFLVLYFGNILINDDASGIGKNIKDIETTLFTVDHNVALLNQDNNYHFNTSEYKNKLKELPESQEATKIIKTLEAYDIDNNLQKLEINLSNINFQDSLNISGRYSDEQQLAINLIKEIENQNNKIDLVKLKIAQSVKELNKVIPQLKEKISQDDHQLNEMIKRLVLSIIIITFLLTILRYSARLYANNHQLMIKAEDEDVAIRKFYVALKNTDKNNEERKIVIENFLSEYNISNTQKPDTSGLSKDESNLLKEIINSLMKKL